jgi:hypothetical protein
LTAVTSISLTLNGTKGSSQITDNMPIVTFTPNIDQTIVWTTPTIVNNVSTNKGPETSVATDTYYGQLIKTMSYRKQ